MTVIRTVLMPLVATFVVSIIPVGILLLLPTKVSSRSNSRRRSTADGQHLPLSNCVLNMMLCFAAGALIADALLHLLVQGIFGDYPSHESARQQALAVTTGVAVFLIIDMFSRLLHAPEAGSTLPEEAEDELELPAAQFKPSLAAGGSAVDAGPSTARRRKRAAPSPTLKTLGTGVRSPSPEHHGGHHGTHQRSNGVLSLIADAIHNFTDGLAIAAAFARDYRLGMTSTMAIFFHEIPHELGDYAVLIKAGFRHQKIIWLQLLTAAGAFLGALTGIAIQSGKIPWLWVFGGESLLPFTAGGFLYVALGTILPGVLADVSSRPSWAVTVGQIFAFMAGIVLMSLIE